MPTIGQNVAAVFTGYQSPSLDLRFTDGAPIDPRITAGRADTTPLATYFDASGTLRFGPTNGLRNSAMAGAAAGTPGTLPTNWSGTIIGLTQQIVGTGTVSGLPYIDIRLSGTTTSKFGNFALDLITNTAALVGQTWTQSWSWALVAGSLTNIAQIGLCTNYYTSGSGFISQLLTSLTPGATLTRVQQSGVTPATTAFVQPLLYFNAAHTSGDAIDFTIRIAGPQLELGPVATGYILTSGTAASGPRLDNDPSTAWTNQVRNSTMVGASAGTPGTLPTNWTATVSTTGLSQQIVGTGTDSGLSYIDMRFFGTAAASNYVAVTFDAGNVTVAINGQTWTASVWVKLVGGTLNGVTSQFSSGYVENNSGGSALAGHNGVAVAPTASWQRVVTTATNDNASTTYVNSNWGISVLNGAAIDFTLRIGAPQLELGAVVHPAIPTSGAIASAGATARGLLIEESRTNGVRNSTMAGASAGTPGTLPTNWAAAPPTGLSRQIVGVGTESGIPYIDIRFFGTAGSAGGCVIQAEPNLNSIAAASGQTWTGSVFVTLSGGSTANIANPTIWIEEVNSGGATVAGSSATFGLSAGSLATSRQVLSRTFNNAGTTCAQLWFGWNSTTNGAAVDITLRIGAPQLELGSFATSFISTSGAAGTRAADIATMPVSNWFNPLAGSFAADGDSTRWSSANANWFEIDDGGATNMVLNFYHQSDNQAVMRVRAGGSNFDVISAGTVMVDKARAKIAGTYTVASGASALCVNGAPIASALAAYTLSASLTTVRLGSNQVSTGQLNGHIRRLRYWPRALGATELQAAAR